jgi:RNA polymerase sigma-54 factor
MINLQQVVTGSPQHGMHISTPLITSIRMLQYSAEEVEQSIALEVDQNPALEVDEQAECPRCGTLLQRGMCSTCDGQVQDPLADAAQSLGTDQLPETLDYNFPLAEESQYDLLEFVPAGGSLGDYLLRQLGLMVPVKDQSIAEYLVGNLDRHGYLTASVTETSQALAVSEDRVRAILSTLQTLDPPGIGTRDLRECLLIQLKHCDQEVPILPLARRLVEGYLPELGEHHFTQIAHELDITPEEVKAAWRFIRSNLNPYPAHAFERNEVPDVGVDLVNERSTLVWPDVVIHRLEQGGFEAEVVETRRYRFNLNEQYRSLYQHCQAQDGAGASLTEEERVHVRQYAAQARFFMNCMAQRWATLTNITEALIVHQREFLEKGVRFLKPLTRAEIASYLTVNASTVSRATSNKYVLLPTGRTISFDAFFDGSLLAKDALQDLVATEDPTKPYADAELARLLDKQGIPLARRTVAKYRESLGILASRFRM